MVRFSFFSSCGLSLLIACCLASFGAVAAPADVLFLDPADNPASDGIEQFRKVYDAYVRPHYPSATYEHRRIAADHFGADASALAPERIRPPKVIVAAHGRIAQTVVRELPGVPLVFLTLGDPMLLQVSDDPIAPRANVTGYTFNSPVELKQIEILQECVPTIRRVGVISDELWFQGSLPRRLFAEARALFGLEVRMAVVETRADVAKLARMQADERLDAWFVPDVPFNREYFREIMAELRATGKPYIAGARYPEALLVYTPERYDPWARVGEMIRIVLSGVQPRDMPFERPKRFQLIVNRKVARALGVQVPRSLLVRAHEVID
jgi:putative ABC transport system substrate-binding protein